MRKNSEDPVIRMMLKEYLGMKASNPPPSVTAEIETRILAALVSKVESLEITRQDMAKKLGSSIRDSGTFEPLGQGQVDNMMLRSEIVRLQQENQDLKEIIKTWNNRKADWAIKIVLAAIGTGALYVWSLVTAAKK